MVGDVLSIVVLMRFTNTITFYNKKCFQFVLVGRYIHLGNDIIVLAATFADPSKKER